MAGLAAVFWREMVIFRRRARRLLASYAVSPALFILAFGWGLGRRVELAGVDYLSFMAPGLLALSSMSHAFSIATDLNVARFYWMTFEEFQTAPISSLAVALGEVAAGLVRGLAAGAVVVVLSLVAGARFAPSPLLPLAVGLNAFQFAAAGVAAAMLVRSHADQASLSSFVILPMSFLCGTFFPLDNLPAWAAALVKLLPLTPASRCIRAAALGRAFPWGELALLAAWGLGLFLLAAWAVGRAEE